MKSNIFIPKKIKVGFQDRSDTYTKKLAYVIYYDEKGVLRKERSWDSWRDNKIDPIEFDNVPTSGFVLNKKAGGYATGWNHRQTYVRVYDSRDFEFEISIPNLLYILENTNSIKGKGLEGEFVYGWDGTELVLMPVDSPDYKEINTLNTLRHECKKYEGKDLILGATYKHTDGNDLIYMGRYYESNQDGKESKTYFFYNLKYECFTTVKNLNKNIIDIIDDKCNEEYANLFDKLKNYSYYSERDQKRDKYVDYTLEEFTSRLDKDYYWGFNFFILNENNEIEKLQVSRNRNYSLYSYKRNYSYNVYSLKGNKTDETICYEAMISEIYNKFKPKYLVSYKTNGELIKEWKK